MNTMSSLSLRAPTSSPIETTQTGYGDNARRVRVCFRTLRKTAVRLRDSIRSFIEALLAPSGSSFSASLELRPKNIPQLVVEA